MKRKWLGTGLVLIAALVCFALFPVKTQAKTADGKTVIVIDPGHGGTDVGAQAAPFGESAMTLYLSLWEAQYLQNYDNVEVYLTHTDDTDMSLEERVDFAVEKNADFLACNHFNDSVNEAVSGGAEVYVTIDQTLFAQEAFFAQTELDELNALGIPVRGIKFRVGSRGDYYGILRRSSNAGLESAIIEHCFLNNESDRAYLGSGGEDTQYVLQTMAFADARAIAKHLHLTSTTMGYDFSNYLESTITWPIVPYN